MKESIKQHIPTLLFDADCGFCIWWTRYWKSLTKDYVRYEPYQKVIHEFPQVTAQQCAKAVQFITPDGAVHSAAHAVYTALSYAPKRKWLLKWYRSVPGFATISEWGYRMVARHRSFFSRLTEFIVQRDPQRQKYYLSRWLFLRGLGIVYLVAFASLLFQLPGLIGENGILPASTYLQGIQEQLGTSGYFLFPTLVWFNSSDWFLQLITLVGIFSSGAVIIGFFTRPFLLFCWVLYLSLFSIGQDFLSFQWDTLLLESGLFAIFFAPLTELPKPFAVPQPSLLFLWLYRWLVFKLVFSSGISKILSGDPSWRDLSALNYHYYTQPIPNRFAWYMQQLPEWFHQLSVVGTFVIEIGAPFLIFAPRKLRHMGAGAIIFLMILIMITGNYAFFNLLTIVLCLLLFDDRFFFGVFPQKIKTVFKKWTAKATAPLRRYRFFWAAILVFSGCFIILLNALHVSGMIGSGSQKITAVQTIVRWVTPYRIINRYGLFAIMTTKRDEIIIEGSDDGKDWKAYEFKWKPGSLNLPPKQVAPHQPRLDWQMWFAALSTQERNPWFSNMLVRLLQGSPQVLKLFAYNPFPDTPPRYIRAVLYEYHFTNYKEKQSSDEWWKRSPRGIYFPISALPQ